MSNDDFRLRKIDEETILISDCIIRNQYDKYLSFVVGYGLYFCSTYTNT
jgi:hypothetical protein